MLRIVGAFLLAAMLAVFVVPAHAQPPIYCYPGSGSLSQSSACQPNNPLSIGAAFTQIARAPDLTAGVATSSVALGATARTARACNTGSVTAYLALGDSTVTATVAGSVPVFAGSCINLDIGTNTYLAGITASNTAVIQTSLGTGVAALGGGGSGSSGGGAVSSVFGRTGAVVANPADYSALTSLAIGAGSAITSSGLGGALTAVAYSSFGTASGNAVQGGVITAGGPTGSATVAPVITYNAAGQLTAVTSATITPAIGSVTGIGTGGITALGVNVGTAGAFVVNGGALGTPSSGVATNLTGTASGLTAGNVTTNANLTGPIASSGNATTITAQTGTGTTFVVQANPSITAPTLTGTTSVGGTANISSPSALVFIHGAAANGTPAVQTIGCENASGTNIAAASSCINWGPLSTGTGAAGTYNISTGFAGLTGSATFTSTSASPAVISQTAHGYVPGQVLQASNSGGALPSGIPAATNLYVLAAGLTVNAYEISLTPGGAAINTTTTGTGTQTMTAQTGVQNAASTVATFGPSGLTGSQVTSALNLTQVWNTSGNVTGLFFNATDVASGATSKLIDLQDNTVSKFSVTKIGNVLTGGTITSTGNIVATLGSVIVQASGFFQMTGRTALIAPADGLFLMQNNAGTSFGRLQFGGTTSSFGSIKLSGTTLAFRLADDSADAPITASNATLSGQLNVTAMTQTAVAQSGTVCYNSGTGAVTYDSTVGCLTSTMTEKDNWQDITPQQALAVVLKMQAGSYTYKKGRGLPDGPQVGLSAEQIATLDDRLVGHRPNGALAGVRYQQASALYPMAIQALQSDNDNLRAELHDLQRRVAR